MTHGPLSWRELVERDKQKSEDARGQIKRAAMPVQADPVPNRWQLGDKVKKKANSSWRGIVCGFYNTEATPNGYSVASLYEPGSVQVWPEAALEDWDGVMVEDELRAEITRLTEALRAAEEREKALLSALEEWMFRYFWRVDGMPVEAARIHAQSRMKIAALVGAKP